MHVIEQMMVYRHTDSDCMLYQEPSEHEIFLSEVQNTVRNELTYTTLTKSYVTT